MRFKRVIAGAASISLMVTPALGASAIAAAPSAAAEVAPAPESVTGNEALGGMTLIIGLLALTAIITAIILATSDGHDRPVSP